MGRWIITLGLALGFSSPAFAAPDPLPPPDTTERVQAGPPESAPPNIFGDPTDPSLAPPPQPPPTQPTQAPPADPGAPPQTTYVYIPEQVPTGPAPGTIYVAQQPPPGYYPVHAARTRLAVIQGLHGAALGGEICALLSPETNERRCAPFPFVLGAAAALTAGLAVREGMTSDHVTAINGGTVLGAWHGVLVLGMSGMLWEPEGTGRQVGAVSVLAGSQIVGTLAGHFIYRAHPSREGVVDAAAVSSIWGGLVTGMLVAGYADPTDADAPHARQFGVMMLGTEIGLGLGVLVGRHTHFTPWRAMMVHSYALGGLAMGLVIGLPVSLRDGGTVDENDAWRVMGYGSLIGAVLGIGATQNLRSRNTIGPAFAVDVTPVRNVVVMEDGTTASGGGGIVNVSGRF